MENSKRIIRIEGLVSSGSGEGTKFTKLPWFEEQVRRKLGFAPYPGTLNLKLDEYGKRVKKVLEKTNSIVIVPEDGYCRGKCFKVRVMDSVEGAVVIPEVEGYPDNLLEVVVPINLREKFGLKDGDLVVLDILVE